MRIEFILLFQAATLLLFYKAYTKRDEIQWAMTVILSGAMIFITQETMRDVMGINIGIFLFSIIFFFIDILSNYGQTISEMNPFKFKVK